jgi:hypothetical protein
MDILGDEITTLLTKAFVDHLLKDTRQRPMPSSWSVALEHLQDHALPCSNPKCQCGYFPLLDNGPAKCPWCGTMQQSFGSLPQLQFYRQGATGHYTPIPYNKVIGWKGRTLHTWHVDISKQRGPHLEPDDEQPIAEFFPHQGDWHLINKGKTEVSVLDGSGFRAVSPQKGVVLKANMRILFGSPENGRMALVQLRRLS